MDLPSDFDPHLDAIIQEIQDSDMSLEEAQARCVEYILAMMTPHLWMSLVLIGQSETERVLDVVKNQLQFAPFLEDSKEYHRRFLAQWEIAALNRMVRE